MVSAGSRHLDGELARTLSLHISEIGRVPLRGRLVDRFGDGGPRLLGPQGGHHLAQGPGRQHTVATDQRGLGGRRTRHDYRGAVDRVDQRDDPRNPSHLAVQAELAEERSLIGRALRGWFPPL